MKQHRHKDNVYDTPFSRARLREGLTIKELSERAGILPSSYTGFNAGSPPILSNGAVKPDAQKLANFFGMTLSDLWPDYFSPIPPEEEFLIDELVDNFHHGLLSLEFADPELQLLEKEKLRVINELILDLPERNRKVIMMKLFDNMTFTDIGLQFGVSTNRILQLFHIAMLRLEFRLKKTRYFEDLTTNRKGCS